MQTKPKNWFVRHKVLTVVLVLLLVVAVAAAVVVRSVMKNAEELAGYSFVRTTTLEQTTLTDSVSVNGTVKAGQDASVTVADAAKLYKVATVNVKVGDEVKKGDVIATLDTTELLKQIEQAELSYSDTLKSAKTSYDRAADSLTVERVRHENNLIDLQANIDAADRQLTEAQESQKKAQDNYNAAKSERDALAGEYNRVCAEVQAYTNQLNTAAAAQESALVAANAALAATKTARAELEQAKTTYGDTSPEYATANEKLQACLQEYNDEATTEQQEGTKQKAYREAQKVYEEAKTALANAQAGCSVPSRGLYGFAAIETAYKTADGQLTQYETALESAKKVVESAEKALKSAHDAYDTEKNYSSLKTTSQNVEDAATRLSQSARTPSNLESLRDTLNSCTLTATMDGTITALNATVGSVCSGAVATIQNTDRLTVEVTIPANRVPNVSEGMACRITSDAAAGKVIAGTLVRIDPVANEKGSFGATVSVDAADAELLIGTQAKVEIIISEKSNVFTVPIDAVGTAPDGSSYVLRQNGGEGIAMTFEEVPVTLGVANDYYVEITGADLCAGDVIRATADLNEGIENSSAMAMGGSSSGGADNSEPEEAPIAFTIEEE